MYIQVYLVTRMKHSHTIHGISFFGSEYSILFLENEYCRRITGHAWVEDKVSFLIESNIHIFFYQNECIGWSERKLPLTKRMLY